MSRHRIILLFTCMFTFQIYSLGNPCISASDCRGVEREVLLDTQSDTERERERPNDQT
jgi:hypothetical protein